MATNLIVLAFLCLAFPGCNRQSDRYLLRTNDYIRREYIMEIARNELGIREATGKNDGKRVEQYLAVTGLKAGHPWCAAFISWVFARAGYQEPRTAW